MSTPAHEQALRLCTFCPKLCRFSCPVSEATQRESLTPWGKMSALARATPQGGYAEASSAATAYGCSDCGRCQEYCRHGVDVPASLAKGRALARAGNQAPAAAREVEARFHTREDRLARLLQGWPTLAPWQYHPGCSSFGDPALVEDARAVLGLVLPGQVSAAGGGAPPCCGYPLYAAGALEAFRAHAQRVQRHLFAGRLIVGDPGCAHTFKVLFAEVGAPLSCTVETLPEVVAPRLPARPARPSERPRYHDACALGRKLGVYEAPRAALAWAAGEAPEELPHARGDALCSGAGGLLPKTMPEAAASIAQDLADLAAESGAEAPLVTGCPGARRALSKAGAPAVDWIRWIRRALVP